MKIGHYMTGISHAGGVASYIRRVARAQSQMGHEVILIDRVGEGSAGQDAAVLLSKDDPDLSRLARANDLEILHLHTVAAIADPFVKTVRTMHGHWPYCPSGSRFFKRQGTACERAYGLFGCAIEHFAGRCGSVRPAQFAAGFKRTWEEMRILPGTRVLAISEFVKSQMVRSGYPAGDIQVLYLPAPQVRQDALAGPPEHESASASFVFLGRLVPEKGLAWLIHAAALVQGSFTLEVAGEGPMLQRLNALVTDLQMVDRVRLHGWLPESRALELINNSRAVIFPSLWHEPAGLVTLEAASCSRAVIASSVGGIPEYAKMLGNAVMVAPNDIPGLARAMQRLLDDKAEAGRLGARGRLEAEGALSLSSHLQLLQRHYEQAIAAD